MTVFYVLLYYVWRSRYQVSDHKGPRPQFGCWRSPAWTSADAPLTWGVYRNIPFAILGALVVVLFYRSAKETRDKPFRFLWLTAVLSFACYIPVVHCSLSTYCATYWA